MNVGQRVMLIGQMIEIDCIPPPIGALGVITGALDWDDEYFVLFDGHPCPWGEPDWFVHHSMLIPYDDGTPLPVEAEAVTV